MDFIFSEMLYFLKLLLNTLKTNQTTDQPTMSVRFGMLCDQEEGLV